MLLAADPEVTVFTIPLWADLLAVAIGSLQGALFADRFRDRRLDLLGVTIIGIVVGLGGGLLRDIFLNVDPVAFQSNWYLLVAVGAALLGMSLHSVFSRLNIVITVLDALTIGLFGAIGVTKALSLGVPVVPSIFIGTVSAVGGSVLRDMLLNIPISVMLVGSLYAVAALAGTVAIVVLAALGMSISIAAPIGVAVTVVIRLLAVRFGWSLPEQRPLRRLKRKGRPSS